MLKKFNQLRVLTDSTVSRFQDHVAQFTSQLESQPQLDNVILKDVALAAGLNRVEHKLGRVFQGWQLIDQDTNATVWRDTSIGEKELFLSLRTSTACTVSILVF